MSEHKNKYIDKAFAKQLPSAFIVASPFQLLCAIEAIHEFEIEKSQIVFVLEKESPRNQQLFAMAENYGAQYDLYYHDDVDQEYTNETKVVDNTSRYDRIFIGDYSPVLYRYLALRYANRDAVLVYLDDGSSTIRFLSGYITSRKPENWRKRLNWKKTLINREKQLTKILAQKSLHDPKCFFTIFSNAKTSKFSVHPNNMRHVMNIIGGVNKEREDIVLIVGTVLQAYAEEVNRIDITLMEAIHWDRLKRIRDMYPNQKIVYIPHGRDNNAYIPQFCSMLDIEYTKISEPIETYMLKSSYEPRAIYSFGSTALYTLHKFYSNAQIVSWKPKHQDTSEKRRPVDEYYLKEGIREEVIWLPKGSCQSNVSFLGNIKSIISLVKDKVFKL